ncbi:methyltransferase domain-containing protein [Streptomyces sp. MUM 203J]|uniref:methyltransferase domain-containing protein n=1 Tax=Streptomyces sp. MUM 203J TaxID=2791990 RepID=UPI001F038961|nr:methyltransferase domain-containing protein [Streptomyces sp. MUM 203J]MCH0543174.1 methyltransferase domain-containing protein [Streptomyces sp. MUM 203J]
MTTAPRGGHAALVDHLYERGLLDDTWHRIWLRVPREHFVPERIWRQVPTGCVPVTGRDRLALIHSDEPVVTQIDDGRPDGPGIATCSNSKPSMVARMLQLLDVQDGHRVLEVGTGTGHLAALLCARVGERNIHTVEVDSYLAHQAADRLSAAGYQPRVVHVDGEWGLPSAAPYDRIVVTCAVRHIPPALLAQLRPGGILVAPLHRDFWSGALVRMTAGNGATGQGHFEGGASYMLMRSHRPTRSPAAVDDSTVRQGATDLAVQELLTLGFALYAGARLPGVRMWHTGRGTGTHVWAQDETGSAVHVSGRTVWQYGPRTLWREIEQVHGEYVTLGCPEHGRFRLSVSSAGDRLMLDHPPQAIEPAPWTLPAQP